MPDLPTLLVQLAVIVVAARLVGRAFRRIGQPQVVGELAAGILLGPSDAHQRAGGRFTEDTIAAVLLLVLASAWVTERLGIHALFGAFLTGAIMPTSQDFVGDLERRLEDLTVVLLLPLFFAFTGLRTQIGLVEGPDSWGYTALIIAVAIAGKFGGSAVAARLTGMKWREAGALGVLMNTRGLMELVVLNIGLDIGVISPALFAMMVLMALITTFMTTPILAFMLRPERPQRSPSARFPAREPLAGRGSNYEL